MVSWELNVPYKFNKPILIVLWFCAFYFNLNKNGIRFVEDTTNDLNQLYNLIYDVRFGWVFGFEGFSYHV